jgi:hypothetical protein
VGWVLSLIGVYIEAYSPYPTRLGGLMLAGPVFTGVAVYASIREYRQSRKKAP